MDTDNGNSDENGGCIIKDSIIVCEEKCTTNQTNISVKNCISDTDQMSALHMRESGAYKVTKSMNEDGMSDEGTTGASSSRSSSSTNNNSIIRDP